jgi:methylphosphotriester-DNA--protein-cysteine methyltransferase
MMIRGTIGGHRGTRIYGRLDCPSALRAIANGGYVKHRVFFVDEPAAIAAGYRPCARCMPVQYRQWKEGTTPADAGPSRCPSKGRHPRRDG